MGTSSNGPIRASGRFGGGVLEGVPMSAVDQLLDRTIVIDFVTYAAAVSFDDTDDVNGNYGAADLAGSLASHWMSSAVGAAPTETNVKNNTQALEISLQGVNLGVNTQLTLPASKKVQPEAIDTSFPYVDKPVAMLWRVNWDDWDANSCFFGLSGDAGSPSGTIPMSAAGALTNAGSNVLGFHLQEGTDTQLQMRAVGAGDATITATDLNGGMPTLVDGTDYYMGFRIANNDKVTFYVGESLSNIKKVGYIELAAGNQLDNGLCPAFSYIRDAAGANGIFRLKQMVLNQQNYYA